MAFQDWSHPSGVGPATMKRLAFGVDLLDADLDGHLDVAFANGDTVPERIAGLDAQQVIGVEGDLDLGADRVGVERIAVAAWHEEVLPREGELGRSGVIRSR